MHPLRLGFYILAQEGFWAHPVEFYHRMVFVESISIPSPSECVRHSRNTVPLMMKGLGECVREEDGGIVGGIEGRCWCVKEVVRWSTPYHTPANLPHSSTTYCTVDGKSPVASSVSLRPAIFIDSRMSGIQDVHICPNRWRMMVCMVLRMERDGERSIRSHLLADICMLFSWLYILEFMNIAGLHVTCEMTGLLPPTVYLLLSHLLLYTFLTSYITHPSLPPLS